MSDEIDYGIDVLYRPVYDADVDGIVGYETQVRIVDEQMGILMPEVYIPVAERTKQCIGVNRYAVEQVARDIRDMMNVGAPCSFVAVYISVKAMHSQDFSQIILNIFEEYKISPAYLIAIVTNDIYFQYNAKDLSRPSAVLDNMNRMQNAGIRFFTNEYGSDACPMMRICTVPVDGCIVSPDVTAYLKGDEPHQKLAAASILMAVEQQLTVWGYADTKAVYEHLKEQQCRYISGKQIGQFGTCQQMITRALKDSK